MDDNGTVHFPFWAIALEPVTGTHRKHCEFGSVTTKPQGISVLFFSTRAKAEEVLAANWREHRDRSVIDFANEDELLPVLEALQADGLTHFRFDFDPKTGGGWIAPLGETIVNMQFNRHMAEEEN